MNVIFQITGGWCRFANAAARDAVGCHCQLAERGCKDTMIVCFGFLRNRHLNRLKCSHVTLITSFLIMLPINQHHIDKKKQSMALPLNQEHILLQIDQSSMTMFHEDFTKCTLSVKPAMQTWFFKESTKAISSMAPGHCLGAL